MTATETLHPELTADLVERIRSLSPAAFDFLREIRERELAVAYDAEVRAHIQAITQRVLSGEEKMIPIETVMAEIDEYLLSRDVR